MQFHSADMDQIIVSLVNIVERFLRRYLPHDGRVCVALSGGLDSIVLLDIVDALKASLHLDLRALSPNADSWATFCAEICDARGIALTTAKVRVDTLSGAGIEGAARKARYAAFAEEGSPYVLLAQHADDQAETVLHQLLRGTGLKGLAGMGEVRVVSTAQILLRPLLHVSRADIEATARERGLKWIEDESNTDIGYMRNFLRHEIAPRLEGRFPHYRGSRQNTPVRLTKCSKRWRKLICGGMAQMLLRMRWICWPKRGKSMRYITGSFGKKYRRLPTPK